MTKFWATLGWLMAITVVVGCIWVFANWMEARDDRKDEEFRQECIAKGGEYVNFETDRYVAVCQLNGQQFSRR